MTLKALVFDVDGTLADTERDAHRVAFNSAFAERGLPWHWGSAFYGELLSVAGGKERLAHYLDVYRPPLPAGVDVQDLIVSLHANKTRHFADLVRGGAAPLRPGILPLIREARANRLKLGIATTTTLANVKALLAGFPADLAEAFDVIGSGDEVARKKPAGDVYRYVLGALGLPPDEALAIEDSEIGLISASAVGLRTLVTTNPYTIGQDFRLALAVADGLGESHQPATVTRAPGLDSPKRMVVDLNLLMRWHGTAL